MLQSETWRMRVEDIDSTRMVTRVRWPSELCGLIVLYSRGQRSIKTLVSNSVAKDQGTEPRLRLSESLAFVASDSQDLSRTGLPNQRQLAGCEGIRLGFRSERRPTRPP